MNDEPLNIRCTVCKVRPTDLNIDCDTIICDVCENMNLKEKNPYILYGKYPFKVQYVEDIDKFHYLKEIYDFVNSKEKK